MRKLFILSLCLLFMSCSQNKSANSEQEMDGYEQTERAVAVGDFDWVLGEWKRTNNEEGKETFETWEKLSENEYQGIGYTLQAGDTISQELMRFTREEADWVLSVSMPGEPVATVFTQVSIGENTFTFENPANEFPSTIRYWKDGEKMMASIFNDTFEIPFTFEGLKQ